MTGDEFIRRARELGRKRNVPVEVQKARGKGSHKRLWYDSRKTTVKKGELPAGTLSAMCKQLGIDRNDL